MTVNIGIIGDFEENRPSHRATNEALLHSAAYLDVILETLWLPTARLEAASCTELQNFDAFFCAPGSPYQSMSGALRGIRYARENAMPFLGTCGGFQHAALEYARNVLGLFEVDHGEYRTGAAEMFISALSCSLLAQTQKIRLTKGTKARRIYGRKEVAERYNCSFGLNPRYQELFEQAGFHTAGKDETGEVRILEMEESRFYIATLFQPQLSSMPDNPHPLINAFVRAAEQSRCER